MHNKNQLKIYDLNSDKSYLENSLIKGNSLINKALSTLDDLEQKNTLISEGRSQPVIENNKRSNLSNKESIIKNIHLILFKKKVVSFNIITVQQNNQIVNLQLHFKEQNTS